MMFLCQILDGLKKLHVLELHDEIDYAASFVAPETVIHILRRRYDERRCLLIVEGAAALLIGSVLLQLKSFVFEHADDINLTDTVDDFLWNHMGGGISGENYLPDTSILLLQPQSGRLWPVLLASYSSGHSSETSNFCFNSSSITSQISF